MVWGRSDAAERVESRPAVAASFRAETKGMIQLGVLISPVDLYSALFWWASRAEGLYTSPTRPQLRLLRRS